MEQTKLINDRSFKRPGQRLASALILAGTALLSGMATTGCQWLFGEDGLLPSRKNDYLQITEAPPLQISSGLKSRPSQVEYDIPEVKDGAPLSKDFTLTPPPPLNELTKRGAVRIQRIGERQWLLVSVEASQLWAKLRGFLTSQGIEIHSINGKQGVIESAWRDDAKHGRERYRFSVEQGLQHNASELHVLHQSKKIKNAETWPKHSNNFTREQAMSQAIAQHLANLSGVQTSSFVGYSIKAKRKLKLRKTQHKGYVVELQLDYARAWASLEKALVLAGFDIRDKNFDRGLYKVALSPNNSASKELRQVFEQLESLIAEKGQKSADASPVGVRLKRAGKILEISVLARARLNESLQWELINMIKNKLS